MSGAEARSDKHDEKAIFALLVSCGVQRALAALIAKWNTDPRK